MATIPKSGDVLEISGIKITIKTKLDNKIITVIAQKINHEQNNLD